MRIVHLAPSAGGGFYCENCIRDGILLRQFHKLGHEAIALPMYLPAGLEHNDIPKGPLFFGGINVYLQQKFGLFRKTPRWLDKILDSPALLSKVANQAGMTSAKELGETTISMLMGCEGRQLKELDRLLRWLVLPENKPDVLILSNALLLGLAGPIRKALGCAMVCLLQDEDGFVDGLGHPWTQQVWDLMRDNAVNVNVFIAVSRYYRDAMMEKLSIEPEKIHCVYPGLRLEDYQPAPVRPEFPTIGFLARMCEDNGLDILINAAHILVMDERLQNIRVLVCGGQTKADEVFLRRMRNRIKARRMTGNISFVNEFDFESRREFLHAVSVISVPFRKPVAYGLCVLEAMASGVGFVKPAAGVFPEYARFGDVGVLYEPNNPVQLANALRPLLLDGDRMRNMGQQSRLAIEQYCNIETTSRKFIELLEGVTGK